MGVSVVDRRRGRQGRGILIPWQFLRRLVRLSERQKSPGRLELALIRVKVRVGVRTRAKVKLGARIKVKVKIRDKFR